MCKHTQPVISVSSEAVPIATHGEPLASPPFMGERRDVWDSQARWPSPETMRLLRAQYAWLEAGSVGESPLALLFKSLDKPQSESEA
jgi:hypothetical protein